MKALKLGHVHLKVRNLDRSIAFFSEVFGLSLEERAHGYAFLTDGIVHHAVALQELGEGATSPGPHVTGLYHVAFEVESEAQFADARSRLDKMGVRSAAVDHGISWAVYFSDPDGNGMEIYLDRRSADSGRTEWHGRSKRLR